MYLRSTPRRNKDGSEVRYLQLAHNVWDPQKRRSTVQVVYNFGREDATNRDALQRLVASVTRFLDPDAALAAAADGLEFTESRPLGGTWALDALWSRLGIGKEMRKLLKGRRLDDSAERVLFALVASRALAPSSKLAAARWASEDVMITGLPVTSDDACYRAMDWLLEIKDDLEKKVFDNLAHLLNLEVDLLFFDYPALGYTVNRSSLVLWSIRVPGGTTRARRESSWPGSAPMRTAWTTWSGCAGPAGSPARHVATPAAGGWAMAGASAAAAGGAPR
jgi:hypothetical protein